MAKILDKSSVEYLRTDLEHDQLFSENTGPVVITTPADLLPSATLSDATTFHTPGNGIVYLKGRAIVQQAIAATTILFEFPDRIRAQEDQTINAQLLSGAIYTSLPLTIKENTIIAAQAFGVLNDELVLDGLFYLTG